MSALSDYLENEILDHILGTGAYTMPTNVYVGLSTGSFNDDNSGTELSGSGYTRKVASFGAASSGTASNDASTSGNLLIHGALTSSKVIESGDILKVAVGDMDITAA